MKTLEHWRPPATCLPCQYSCQQYVMTCREVTWRHRTWQSVPVQANPSENHVFQRSNLDLWPMTLTFQLIRDMVKVNLSTKFWVRMSNGSAGRALTNRHTHRRMDRQTDRREISILGLGPIGDLPVEAFCSPITYMKEFHLPPSSNLKYVDISQSFITSRVDGRGNVFGPLRLSICRSVLLSVCLWTLSQPNCLTYGHENWWRGVSGQYLGRVWYSRS